ncbi:MAG TPA: formate dehydrogenase subunit gamma [Steroidobacteraceae bacterium]|nr:formate dehydrogenase subunit gamma [Steroidobacteraceae bacterium]
MNEATINEAVQRALARVGAQPGPLLEILHAVQDELGCVPAAAVPPIAAALNLSRAEVHGVVSFYHHFRGERPGTTVVQLCRAEACQAMNARALEEHATRRLGVGLGETTPDGRVTLEAVYCLGNCACAPSMMVDGELHGRVTPATFDALARDWSAS